MLRCRLIEDFGYGCSGPYGYPVISLSVIAIRAARSTDKQDKVYDEKGLNRRSELNDGRCGTVAELRSALTRKGPLVRDPILLI